MPSKHVALLRGINVGGHNRVPMADLREMFGAAGASEVLTYIQSGNVVFDAPAKRVGAIVRQVRAAIAEQLGLEIPLVVRSAAAIAKIAHTHPFAGRVDDPKFLMVAFLDAKPSAAKVAALDPQPLARRSLRGPWAGGVPGVPERVGSIQARPRVARL